MQTIPKIYAPDTSAKYRCGKCPRSVSLAMTCFCQSCTSLLCPLCVTSQIHSLHCPSCLDSVLEEEARVFNNRCKKCFVCPDCSCSLTFKSSKKQSEATDSSPGAEEQVFLSCHNCLWSSFDPANPSNSILAENPTSLITTIMALEKEDENSAWLRRALQQVQKITEEDTRRESSDTIGSYYSQSLKNLKTQILGNSSSVPDAWPEIKSESKRPVVPQRRPLMPLLDKYCASCSRLLVRPDNITTSPLGGGHSVLDFKRRHVGTQLVPWIYYSVSKDGPDADGFCLVKLRIKNSQPTQPLNVLIRPSITKDSPKYSKVDMKRLPSVASFSGEDATPGLTMGDIVDSSIYATCSPDPETRLLLSLDVKFSSSPITSDDQTEDVTTVTVDLSL